jgi:excisionase family DNA binding protein
MPTLTPDTPLAYRPRDAARILGIGRSLLYELIAAGKITTRKLGAVTLVPRAELERYLDSLPVNDTWDGER